MLPDHAGEREIPLGRLGPVDHVRVAQGGENEVHAHRARPALLDQRARRRGETLAVERTFTGGLMLHAVTHVPTIDVPQVCTGAPKQTPAHGQDATMELPVASSQLLWMGVPNTEDTGVTPDRKSIYVKKYDWTWTFTPSIVEGSR